MEVAMNKCSKECEDEKMKRKKNEVDWFSFLPDDVVLDILKRLPDVFLRYKAKHVCRQWFNIITNMILLDHASFILHRSFGSVRHVDVREERQEIEVKEHNVDIHFCEKIISWYNEFFLITNLTKRRNSLYVFNLITKEKSFLPQCQTYCGQHSTSKCAMALSFDRFKGIYKVVHLFMGPPIECHILHLERDIVSRVSSKWKKIKVPSYKDHKGEPVAVQVQGRYFHWDIKCSKYLVSVDMIKEEIIQMRLPESGDCNRLYYSIFEMGGFLGLIDGVSWDKCEIWILKDFQRMKWEKLQSIRWPNTSFWYPVCGVIRKRYVIFRKFLPGSMLSYDLQNGVFKELNIRTGDGDHCLIHSSAPTGIITRDEVLM